MLVVHRAERADALVRALATILDDTPADPFAGEVVAVPSRGIERWLGQQLSNVLGASPGRGDGIFANVDLPFPARLAGRATQAATGVDPATDPWDAGRAVWPLLDVVEQHRDAAWMRTLARHIGEQADERRSRRFAAVRHVADLFDRYDVHRPAMIVRWAAGDDTDAAGVALPADAVWQARLWRLLRERLGVDSPAQRLDAACARLRAEPSLIDLPERLALFGMTRLTPSLLAVLDAVAAGRDVHLMLLHPSPAWWSGHGAPRHPLLATWGRDACGMRTVLALPTAPQDRHHPAAASEPSTLLHVLQAAVRDDRPPPGAPVADRADGRFVLDPADRSVQVHACHGRPRQVEVLRDAILHLLADDPTLEPRDVIVMCPEIETYAPLVNAAFGAADDAYGSEGGGDDGRLRVRLADRAVRQVNPVLAALDALLDLAASRVTAAQVVDFAGLEAVRRRFRFDDEALARIEEWVAAAGVRWGLDAAHRAPFKLDVLPANTWRAGLDRVLLGVSMSEDDLPLVGGTLPLDDVDSGDIELAGRFAELVDRLGATSHGVRRRPADRRLGCGHRRGGRRARRRAARPGVAADRARCAARRPHHRRRRGRVGGAVAGRGALGARRRAARPPEPGELPHRPPDGVHAGADALGAAPRDLPARPGRRGLPPPRRARRRRPAAARPAAGRPRRAQRGSPTAPRRADGRRRQPADQLQRARRADERGAAARRADRRAARRRRRDRAHRRRPGTRAGRHRAPAAAVRRPQLRVRRAGPHRAVELRPRGARWRRGPPGAAPEEAPVPRRPAAGAVGRDGGARRPRPLRRAPDPRVPPPAAGDHRRRRRRRGARRDPRRPRRARRVARRRPPARCPPGRHRLGRGRGRRAGARRAAARARSAAWCSTA